MQVTFIQPYYHNIWESLGIGYIVSYCKKHYKGQLSINFFQGNFDSDDTIIEEAVKSDIVAFSCTTPTFAHGVRLAKTIKQKNNNVKTVFGGWHVTSLGALSFEDGVDQIVIGEGEQAFLDILNGNNDKIVLGTKLGWGHLEWPDRTVIKNGRTLDLCEQMTGGLRIGSFQANRGCPFSCAFCSESCMTGQHRRRTNPIRTRSVGDLCNEVEAVISTFSLNYFKFVDATFDASPQFVIDFCKEKLNRSFAKMPWEMLIHASLATEEMYYWLEQANCKLVAIGIESGSLAILKDIGKGLTPDIIRRVVGWGKKYNIETRGFFILGMPNETEEDYNLTEALIDEVKLDVVGFTILCPYPGSDFYNHDKFKDIVWSDTDEYYNDFWATKNFTNQQLKDKQQYFINKYSTKICGRQNETN